MLHRVSDKIESEDTSEASEETHLDPSVTVFVIGQWLWGDVRVQNYMETHETQSLDMFGSLWGGNTLCPTFVDCNAACVPYAKAKGIDNDHD